MIFKDLKSSGANFGQKTPKFMPVNYKLAKIYKGKEWYVYFSFNQNYRVPGAKPKFKRFKERFGLNSIKDLKEREKTAKQACEQINEILKEGFNPFEKSGKYMTLVQGLDWAYDKKVPRWAVKTRQDFKSNLNKFKAAAIRLKLDGLPIGEIKPLIIREILDEMTIGLGAHAYNKYKANIGNLFEELVSYEKIESNPCLFRSPLKKPKPKAKRLLNEEERGIVKRHVLQKCPAFYNFMMFIFHTAIRPGELFKLKVKDVNLHRGEIFLSAANAKDKEDRVIIIPDVLREYIVLSSDPNAYLFGIDFTPEKRTIAVREDRANKLWKRLIKQDLGIESNLYWLKDLGLTIRRAKGMDTEAIQLMAGHSSYDMSRRYVKLDRPDIRAMIKGFEGEF